jgi:hypothetical protein
MLRVSEAETPLLKLDPHHPAFVLRCAIEYIKYMSICEEVCRFDFGKTDVDEMILQLPAVDWSDFFRSNVSTSAFKSYMMLFTSALRFMFQNTS